MVAYWLIRAGEIKDQDALEVYQKLWSPLTVHYQQAIKFTNQAFDREMTIIDGV